MALIHGTCPYILVFVVRVLCSLVLFFLVGSIPVLFTPGTSYHLSTAGSLEGQLMCDDESISQECLHSLCYRCVYLADVRGPGVRAGQVQGVQLCGYGVRGRI